jgi:class 3 adenylate cyclase
LSYPHRVFPDEPALLTAYSLVVLVPVTRYTRNGNAALAYQVVGEGPLNLVFHLGRATQLDVFWEHPAAERFFRRLASFARLILYDRQGEGLSSRRSHEGSFEQRVSDLLAVLDAVEAERAALFTCHLVGRTSLVFAATYPERTSALVLYASHPTTLQDVDYPWGATSLDNEEMAADFAAGWGSEEHEATRLKLLAPSAADDPGTVRWYARMLRASMSPPEAAAHIRSLPSIDVRYVLPTISAPTLLLHRVGDRVAGIEASRYMAERIPGARLVELKGNDHLPMFGDAEALLDEVQEFLTGVRPALPPERILASVVFTDIVDSTSQAARLGDAKWRRLLEDHNRLVRDELCRFNGCEVNTTGDGFIATFDSPTRAICCAQGIVRAAPALGIELRAGIHTGECERTTTDVGGIAVHLAARVSALAGGSEVLVSHTVKDLTIGSGIEFCDRGEYELKGVPGRWRLFAVEG